MAKKIDAVTAYVRALGPEYYLLREAAEILGITPNRLRRIGTKHPETLGAGAVTWMGDLKIFLYTEEDLDQIRAYFAELRTYRPAFDVYRQGLGRTPMWSPAEHADRKRRHAVATYQRKAAERYEREGNAVKAARARKRSTQVKAALKRQYDARKARLTPGGGATTPPA